jgi:hypothetical protein
LTQWISFIGEMLRSGQTTQIGLLLHWGHDLEEGRIGIERQEWFGLQDLALAQLLHIQEDVLYRYRL